MYIDINTYIKKHIYIYKHIYTHVNIYIYTHTHAYNFTYILCYMIYVHVRVWWSNYKILLLFNVDIKEIFLVQNSPGTSGICAFWSVA